MIRFADPWWLLLALPWAWFWWRFARREKRAMHWVETQVAARRRPLVTRHDRRSLGRHLGLILATGLILTLAAARPEWPRGGQASSAGGTILLLFDASASMYAEDACDPLDPSAASRQAEPQQFQPQQSQPQQRFVAAQKLAALLVDRLPGPFLVASYSGEATVHLPATADRSLVHEAIDTIEVHDYYRSTGSSLVQALDLILELAGEGPPDLQVVLLGDGEQPFAEEYGEALAAVAARGLPVHAVSLGSEEGQARVIYDMADAVAGKPLDQRRVLREYSTKRVDTEFARIADATGGIFRARACGEVATDLVRAFEDHRFEPSADFAASSEPNGGSEAGVPRPLGRYFALLALALFACERLLLARRSRAFDAALVGFDLGRLGRSPRASSQTGSTTRLVTIALLGLAAMSCSGSSRESAHRENERGIAFDAAGLGEAARTHYRRSMSLGERSEIPTYNLARSWTLEEEFSEAHRISQEVIARSPDLLEAYFNDGVALYGWGVAQEDPRGCSLEATRDLWRAASDRFAEVAERASKTSLGNNAEANRAFLGRRLAVLERQIAEPPAECQGGEGEAAAEPPPPSSSSPSSAANGGDADLDAPLDPEHLEQIGAALARIREQGREEGKYHRRTRAEQFPEESWRNPEDEIWW